ncbi:MAG: hypothetical protein QOC93_145 [Actinomycetota bacterium]|jgi:O-antigen ligase|nr:O-antigen polymerase family protein [Cryptosporangiaceae bacterium]MDQ1675001.1 hypothetical protein [Actinomycetota bacterium]
MERRRVGGSYADDSFARVPILLALVMALVVAGPMLAADKLPGALCALTVFGTALWRPRFALVAAFPAFLLTSALGMSTVFLVGVPLVAAMVTAFVAGELRIDGRRHLALAGFALWMAGSVLTIPAAPFLQTSRLSDAVTLVLGVLLAGFALSVAPSPVVLRLVTIATTSIVAAGLLLGTHPTDLDGRPTAFGLGTNALGLLIAMGLACAIVQLHTGNRLVAMIALPIQAAGLWMTQSRGALVALGCGLAVYAAGQLLAKGSRRQRIPVAGAVVLIAAGLAAVVYSLGDGAFGVRSASSLDANNASRSTAALHAIRLASEHPLFGIGYGNFPSYTLSATNEYINTHNDFLRLAAETGLPGLALFLLVLAGILTRSGSSEWQRTLPLIVTFVVGQLFINSLSYLTVATPFWIAIGALSSRRHRVASTPSATPPRSTAIRVPVGTGGR